MGNSPFNGPAKLYTPSPRKDTTKRSSAFNVHAPVYTPISRTNNAPVHLSLFCTGPKGRNPDSPMVGSPHNGPYYQDLGADSHAPPGELPNREGPGGLPGWAVSTAPTTVKPPAPHTLPPTSSSPNIMPRHLTTIGLRGGSAMDDLRSMAPHMLLLSPMLFGQISPEAQTLAISPNSPNKMHRGTRTTGNGIKPVDTKPVDTKPVDTKPRDAKSDNLKPGIAKPVKPQTGNPSPADPKTARDGMKERKYPKDKPKPAATVKKTVEGDSDSADDDYDFIDKNRDMEDSDWTECDADWTGDDSEWVDEIWDPARRARTLERCGK
ncbi:hypothetical protein GGR53DRAFT_468036 [Hypoxylon sp. FL1150]|nr:hypothetical protein GGR53DRAFT_468036 [Hypoxylon sp. FL1150]